MLFPNKNALSHQISKAIKKKWSKECSDLLDEVVNNEPLNSFDKTTNIYPIQNANSIAFNRINDRLAALEELNDHLCYYVSFLIENLPDLIIKTIQSGVDDNHTEGNNGEASYFKNIKIGAENICPFPTRREHDVLELLEKGLCAKEIATRLYISETTVITHKKNLKRKFNVKNTAELISRIRSRR